MPAMTKTWQFATNQSNTAAGSGQNAGVAYLFWSIKQFLTGASGAVTQGMWTVYYSCDSVTAGTPGDGVDRWTTSANVVFATALSGARSWMVLKSPVLPNGMTVYLFLQATNWVGGVATAGYANIFYCKTAPTGGTTTAEPSFTDSAVYRASGANTASFALQTSTANRRMHFGLTTDGATMYFISGAVGAGYCEHAYVFSLLSQAKSADQYPFYQYHWANASTPGPLSGGTYLTSGVGFLNGQPNGFGYSATRTFNGAALANQFVVWPMVSTTSTLLSATAAAVTNAADPIDTTYFDFPCYVGFCNTLPNSATVSAGGQQIRGILPDFAIAPDVVAQSTADGPAGAITSAKIGSLWVPMNVVPLM